MEWAIHNLSYDHGKIDVTVVDGSNCDANTIGTSFTLPELIAAVPEAKEAWEAFGNSIEKHLQNTMMDMLKGSFIPDAVPSTVIPTCRICDIRQDDPRTDAGQRQVVSSTRAYCPPHRTDA